MACLLGHKWNGCKCTKCGKVRDSDHDFSLREDACEAVCRICGKTQERHNTVNGFCTRCGRQSPYPILLKNITTEERFAVKGVIDAVADHFRGIDSYYSPSRNDDDLGSYYRLTETFKDFEVRKDLIPVCERIQTALRYSPDYFTLEEADLMQRTVRIASEARAKDNHDLLYSGREPNTIPEESLKSFESKLEETIAAFREEAARRCPDTARP